MEYDQVRQIRIDKNHRTYLSAKVARVRSDTQTRLDSDDEILWSPSHIDFEKQSITLKVAVILELRPIK